MNKQYQKAWLRSLAGLCVNISAAWFGLAFITPNFASLSNIETVLVLTRDIVLGIVFLLLTVQFEREME